MIISDIEKNQKECIRVSKADRELEKQASKQYAKGP